MMITLNSTPKELAERSTVESLLRELNMSRSPCAVEVNRQLVPKASHPGTELHEGDVVEIVTLVGGG